MKHLIPLFIFTFAFVLHLSLSAAVPLRWTVETSRAQPATFEAYQGETLEFEAELRSYGYPLAAPQDYSIYWQTNGMGNAYWSAHCESPEVETNVLFATWLPAYDVGARVYNCVIGSPSNIYHAAFQLILRTSPGAVPNELPLPQKVIDFSKVTVLNPPWSGGGSGVDTNAVLDLIGPVIETNATVVSHTSQIGDLQTSVTSSLSSISSTVSSVASDVAGKRDILDLCVYSLTDDWTYMVTGNGTTNDLISVIGGYLMWDDDGWMSTISGPGWYTPNGPNFISGDRNATRLDYYFAAEGPPDEHGVQKHYQLNVTAFRVPGPAISRLALLSDIPTPLPYLRVYDAVRGCWWIGRMVNGVINWEVEE